MYLLFILWFECLEFTSSISFLDNNNVHKDMFKSGWIGATHNKWVLFVLI